MAKNTEQDIKQLNSFLRGELAAVETYQQCIEKVEDENVRSQLLVLKESHRIRVILLKERVLALGGQPEESAGVWGSVTKAVEGSATLFGAAAAVSMLEEGEDHGLSDYRNDLENLSPAERLFVESKLLPEQQRSHDALSRIEKAL
jgi:uncharacterized protein (TIGR02284 family)